MRDILDAVTAWTRADQAIAIATVVQTWGSAPRGVGSKMALTADLKMAGSVSGGCVEGAVVEAGLQVIESGVPQLLHFGVADETAWEVGLSCGGTIEIFVEKLVPTVLQFWQAVAVSEPVAAIASATVIRGSAAQLGKKWMLTETGAQVGEFDQNEFVLSALHAALQSGETKRVQSLAAGLQSQSELFLEVSPPPLQLICIGGGHVAVALTQIAKSLGYRTVVIDPRTAFASAERFPHIDCLIAKWPSEALNEVVFSRSTAVAALTHDPKIDDKALLAALHSSAFYVGALGSKKTHAARVARLAQAGLSEHAIQKIHAPIGLSIGARTPEEIALAIMAEIVQTRNGAK